MNILETQNRLMYDSSVWGEIKNDDILLTEAINVKNTKNDGVVVSNFKAPYIAYYILNNREDVNPNVFNYLKDTIFSNISIARCEIANNTTYLYQLFSSPNLMLRDNEKRFAVYEALNAYKKVSDNMSRSIHGIEPYDLKFLILMNPSWSEEEKKELIYKFYRFDQVYYNRLYSFYNYYDGNDSYKVKLFDFLGKNMPSSYEDSLEKSQKKLVK